MRNIAPVEKIYKLRTWDMKGCDFLRKTDLNNDFSEERCRASTLKDIDFKDKEKIVNIKDEHKKQCRDQMIKDVNFLTDLNFFDYSLVLFKINWQSKMKNYEEYIKNNFQHSELQSIPSTTEDGVHYHMGIIDFL